MAYPRTFMLAASLIACGRDSGDRNDFDEAPNDRRV